MPETGDRVFYVPDQCHALDRMPDGRFCWVWAERSKTSRRSGGRGSSLGAELSDEELGRRLARVHTSHDSIQDTALPVRPRVVWEAVVRAVDEGDPDVLSLDIAGSQGGVTLHYDGVTYDSTGNTPNTWCSERPSGM